MATSNRVKVAGLVLSASTLVGIAVNEAYKPVAYMPTPQDRPTLGFGETKGVKMGDKTTPERALVQLLQSAEQHADGVRDCVAVPLFQYEFEAYVDLAYNIGVGAFCGSTLTKKLNAGDYEGACREILKWDKQAGHVLRGLTIRRQAEFKKCTGGAA